MDKQVATLHRLTSFTLSQFRSKPTDANIAFCNSQITEYGRRGDLRRAQSIFDQMPFRDVVSWTALLSAYAQTGQISTARHLFDEMPHRNTAAWNAMVSAYALSSTDKIAEAFQLFSRIPEKNLVSYSAMISGFAKKGMMRDAARLYDEMPHRWRDPLGSNALINGYLKLGQFHESERIFRMMSVRDVVSWTSMLDGYCKSGRISQAMQVFQSMPERNVVSWTSMIRGLLKCSSSSSCRWEDGFGLFLQMRREGVDVNSTTLSVLVDACAVYGRVGHEGLQIHGLVLLFGFHHDAFLANSIIDMYCRDDRFIQSARACFEYMGLHKDVVSWNSIINGYVQHDRIEEAYALFQAMPQKDIVSWTSMLVGFSNRGHTSVSVHLFEAMPEKDHVAWTALISGLVQNGENGAACWWFRRMMQQGIRPDPMALCSVLSAIANLAAILIDGLQIHSLVIKLEDPELDVSILASLISMYAKCGDLTSARQIFAGINKPNIVAFNSMMTGFAQHGLAREALDLFVRMEAHGNCKPNHVTFLEVLSACSHAGLVQQGNKYFESMTSYYGIEPGPDHYTCMVDLLGRAGLLQQAKGLIDSMPFPPTSSVWGALLYASRLHCSLNLARLAAARLFELEPDNAASYAVLSNVYAEAGMKETEEKVRLAKSLNGAKKNAGCTWINFNGT